MVSYKIVNANNESLRQAGPGLTAVFVGATNGIGLGALRAFIKYADAPTVYLVGRSAPRLKAIINELKGINGSATVIPVQAQDLTLVKDAQKAAEEIAQQAKKVDLLIMSPGYLSLSRHESPEGLDRVTAIRFYARMRFLITLAPLLRAAPAPRIVTVLAGGSEGPLWLDDLPLKEHYSIVKAAGAACSMTTLFLEEFARQPGNEKMAFAHTYPGAVGDTGLSLADAGPILSFFISWVLTPLMRLAGYTSTEAGARVIFAATSGQFARAESGVSTDEGVVQKGSDGKTGSGVYLVGADSRALTGNKVLNQLRDSGAGPKVYEHTLEQLDRISQL